nr:MAG TPA: hypothetical protein [Caudoviricetes sp.]
MFTDENGYEFKQTLTGNSWGFLLPRESGVEYENV